MYQVFERAQEYKRCGAGVSLVANGLNALEAVDPDLLQWCMENSLEPEGTITSDHTGEITYRQFFSLCYQRPAG